MLSPPSSSANAPHSGTVANTLSIAYAGVAMSANATAIHVFQCLRMSPFLSELVRAVRAKRQDVLNKKLVVGDAGVRLAAERRGHDIACSVRQLARTIDGACIEIRQSRTPARARADVAAGVNECAPRACAIVVAWTTGKCVAVADLCAEFEERV